MSTLSKAYCIYAIVYSTELLKSFFWGMRITVAAVELNAGANMHKQPMSVELLERLNCIHSFMDMHHNLFLLHSEREGLGLVVGHLDKGAEIALKIAKSSLIFQTSHFCCMSFI